MVLNSSNIIFVINKTQFIYVERYIYCNMFYPSETISKISKIIKAKYDQPWLEWNEIPSKVKSMWFEDFKKYCMWDEAHGDEIVRIWKRKSSQIIRQSLSDTRRE